MLKDWRLGTSGGKDFQVPRLLFCWDWTSENTWLVPKKSCNFWGDVGTLDFWTIIVGNPGYLGLLLQSGPFWATQKPSLLIWPWKFFLGHPVIKYPRLWLFLVIMEMVIMILIIWHLHPQDWVKLPRGEEFLWWVFGLHESTCLDSMKASVIFFTKKNGL